MATDITASASAPGITNISTTPVAQVQHLTTAVPIIIDDTDYPLTSYLIVVIAIICNYVYIRYVCPYIGDPLSKSINCKDLTYWSLFSILMYALIGYYSPNYGRRFIMYSCVYEGFKHMLSMYGPSNVSPGKFTTIFGNYIGTFVGIIVRLIMSGYYSHVIVDVGHLLAYYRGII